MPVQVGSYNDGNFYQLLSISAMQLLGIGTLIWPTLFSGRLVNLPRVSAWILACTSIFCTVISIPLYLYAPNCLEWNAFILWQCCSNFGFITARVQSLEWPQGILLRTAEYGALIKVSQSVWAWLFEKIVFGKKPVSNVTIADQFISKEIFPDEITFLIDRKDPALNSNSIHILVTAQYFMMVLGDIHLTYSNPYKPPHSFLLLSSSLLYIFIFLRIRPMESILLT